MADNKEIVRSLTEKQKLELTANVATQELASGGIQVKFADYGKTAEKSEWTYPSFKAVANSWNADLIKNLWRCVAAAERDKSDAVISPHTGVCNSPYAGGVTEDPYIEAAYLKAFISGVTEFGLTPVVDCGFKVEDLWYIDEEFSDRAFHEYYALPYANLPAGTAFKVDDNKFEGKYSGINAINFNNFIQEYNSGATVIANRADKEDVGVYIKGGSLLLNCEAADLQPLFGAEGGAEKLDSACGKAVDFALEVKENKDKLNGADISAGSVSPVDIAEQSCILLKNNGALPLKKGSKISVSGGFSYIHPEEFCNMLQKGGQYSCTWSKGFNYDDDITPGLEKKAAEDAAAAQYVILFLGFDDVAYEEALSQKRTTLPANLLGLYYEVSACNNNVILVVNSDYYTDLSFAKSAAAVLLCPATGEGTLQALYNVVTGVTSPSGRLVQTRYADTDANFCLIKNMRESGTLKTGICAGYRGGADKTVLYPFGHGLSYTQFVYSDLAVTPGGVKFTVKNVGKMAAYEVVQIYTGKRGSPIVRPVKILSGLAKVFLRPGEGKTLTVKINPETLKVYSEGKYVTEGGAYDVYIGASSTDIRLKGTMNVNGGTVKKDGENPDDYRRTASNVFSGGHTFGKVKTAKIRGKGLLKAGAVFAFAAIFTALFFGTAHLAGYVDLFALDLFSLIVLSVFSAFAAFAVILSLFGGIEFMVSKAKGIVVTTGEPKEGVKLPEEPHERLFAELYGPDKYYLGKNVKEDEKNGEEEEKKKKEEEEKKKQQVKPVFIGEYDPSVTFLSECSRLNNFLADNGMNAGVANSRHILASFAASRVIILGGNLKGFEKIITGFFGCENYGLNLADYADASSLVNGENGLRPVLGGAAENPDVIYLVSLYGASEDGDLNAFKPFLKCAYAEEEVNVVYQKGKLDGNVTVPANVWFLLVPDEEKGICFTDKEICNCTAVLAFDYAPCDAAEQINRDKTLNFYQFERMLEKLVKYDDEQYSLSEDHCWKKIDRLVRVLYNKCGYSLDNRNTLSVERYSAVYLACEGEQNNALDGAVAAKIALSAASAMRNRDDEEENISSIAEGIFDEYENIQRVLNLYRRNAR